MAEEMIQLHSLHVRDHRYIAERALKFSKRRHPDHPWSDDWGPAANFAINALQFDVSDARGAPVY
jgi:hypothetical protein